MQNISAATISVVMLFLLGRGGNAQAQATPTDPKQASDDSKRILSAPAAVTATIHGVCRDQDAKPVAAARIRLFECPSGVPPSKLVAETTSDAEGKFSFSDVVAGDEFSEPGPFIVATAPGHASYLASVNWSEHKEKSIRMSNRTGTLSGIVTDEAGRPLQGVTVYQSGEPITDYQMAITDERGRFAINDLPRWTPEDQKQANQHVGSFFCVGFDIRFWRSDFAVTTALYTNAPQEVALTLTPPAIVEGRVIDEVTGKPLAGAAIAAQGIVRGRWDRSRLIHARSDRDGRYRLLLNKDHYNIWAEADDRIGIELKAVEVKQEATVNDADIHMVRGGFVSGIVRDVESDRPIHVTKGHYCRVEVYGPSRSRSRSISNAVPVSPDGAFRVRVAPGRNFLSFGGGAATDIVEVKDGEELKFDMELARRVDRALTPDDDPELHFAKQLTAAAWQGDAKGKSP